MENEIRWLLQEKYDGELTAAAKKDIKRLKAGEPLDYVIGFVEFLGCKIDLSKKPLIPRFETEFWVEEVFGQMSNVKGQMSCLDMFSGSGAIGISIMRHIKNAHVTFVDSEKNCIQQIKINCKKNKITENRYSIVQSNIFDQFTVSREKGRRFDYIFANPPYIPKKRVGKIQKSVLDYEAHAALFGGEDGLVYIRKFLALAKNFLNHGGRIYMEFDSPQKSAIRKLLKKYGYKKWDFRKDQYNKWRWITVQYEL